MSNTVYLARKFSCDAEELYQWLTQPQLIIQWFGPEQLTVTHVENSIIKGGNYSIKLIKPNGSTFYIEGHYTNLEKPTLVEFTLRYRDVTPSPPESVVTMKLVTLENGRSELKLKQVFMMEPSDMVSRTKGWEHMLSVLASLACSQEPN